jgi:DNA (cytosine-5)-methyltransferase 1
VNELALFAGAGGGILGGHLLGWRTVCAVEWEPYAASVLVQRQNDGVLPTFPIWDDVQTFDGRPWRGIVDVVSGGFPCQDISAAGKGAGIDGERSGMWREMARLICEVRPRYAFIENSPMLTTRGLDVVLSDLASMGFDARWGVLGAADVGAPHQRDRIWVVAHARGERCELSQHALRAGRDTAVAGCEDLAYSNRKWKLQQERSESNERRRIGNGGDEMALTKNCGDVRGLRLLGVAEKQCRDRASPPYGSGEWWKVEPDVGRVADGVAARVDRLKAIGNGQVPAVAATAWKLLTEEMQ